MSGISITILTPSFNRGGMVARAIESVRDQEIESVEHIVIDGMSSDETPDVLAKYPSLTVIREPDRGMYDAINKGLARASGDVIGLLNTDDVYTPGCLSAVSAAFENPDVEAVFGGAEIYEVREGAEHVIASFITPEKIDLTWENVTVGVGIINARFWRKSFVQRVGDFDLRYPIASDRDWMIRALLLQPRAVLLDQICYRYLLHGESLTVHYGEPRYREEHLAMARRYLARKDLPVEARSWIERLHSKETIEGAIAAAYKGDIGRVFSQAVQGIRVDSTWPLRLGREAIMALNRRLGR